MDRLLKFSRLFCRFGPSTIGSTFQPTCLTTIRTNCHRASIAKMRRSEYKRTYPVKLIQPDGSSFTIRNSEPRKMIVMPINLLDMTPDERKIRYKRMDPPKREVMADYDDDDFHQSKYIDKMKR